MSNLNRGHSINDSYQVSVVAMLANDWDKMSIDASYQEASTCMEGSVLSFLKGE
jgi:hypothetical protein